MSRAEQASSYEIVDASRGAGPPALFETALSRLRKDPIELEELRRLAA